MGAGDNGLLQLAGGLLVGGYALFQLSKDGEAKRAAKQEETKKETVVHHHHYYGEDGKEVKQVSTTNKPATTSNDDAESASSYSSDEQENAVPGWMASSSALPDKQAKAFAKYNSTSGAIPEEEEEHIPAWMSRKEPQTSVGEVATLRTNKLATETFSTASDSVSRVAFAFSDAVFVYPGASKSFVGASELEKNSTNVNGHSVQVQVMETRAGAGDAVVGALSNGASATVLASSASLKEMLPSIFEMAQQRLPAVFHVSASTVDDELAVRQDLAEVMAVRDAGMALLSSGSAQEAHDFAVLAHILSTRTSNPLMHFFDGARTAHQLSKVRSVTDSALQTIASKHSTKMPTSPTALAGLEAASHPDMPHLASVVQQAMRELSSVFGTEYGIFEYSGAPNAEAVVIAMGSVANVVEAAVRNTRNVGVLKVRLLKPWSAAHLLEALPESARRVCVIDQSESLPLFAEVAASFHSSAAIERGLQAPLLVGGRLLPTSSGFSPSMVHAVLNNLMSERPQPNFSLGGHSASSLQVDFTGVATQSAGSSVVVFGSNKHSAQIVGATQSLAEQLAGVSTLNVQYSSSTDTYAGDAGVVRAEIRLASAGQVLPEAYEVVDASVVVIEQALLGASGPAAASALRNGGTLVVLPTPPTPPAEGAETDFVASSPSLVLPLEVRGLLARKAANVASVDALGLLSSVSAVGSVDTAVFQSAALWLALASSLNITVGAKTFESLLSNVRSALRGSKTFNTDVDSSLVNVVGSGLAKVDGYTTHHGKGKDLHMHFPGPTTLENKHSELFELETTSIASSGFGALSPIHPASVQARFVPRLVVNRDGADKGRAGLGGSSGGEIVKLNHKAALTKIFPEAYGAEDTLRPSEHAVHLVRLTKNKRLTPNDYDRHIFHLEFDISDTNMTYEIGDALGVYGHNDVEEIDAFIKEYGLNPSEIVAIPARGQMDKGSTELVSVRNLLIQHLDILGKPSKKFYVALAGHAASRYEYLKLMHTGTDDNEAYKLGVNEGTTYADLLLHYKTANPSIEQIVEMVPAIKARHYSIASSMKMTPRSVHLLVVAVDWVTPLGRKKYGQCTRYLANLEPSKGDIYVAVDVMPSVLRLPPSSTQPIIMAGLGTGLAPFRAFMQYRKWQKEMGMEVGPCVLYFGARHRHEEYLYGDEWDAYEKEGLLKLGLAFSRDQERKVYIQHKIDEDKLLLDDLLGKRNGYFYLCGPTWPVPAVATAISKALNPEAAARGEVDMEQVEKLKQQGRYILEVY